MNSDVHRFINSDDFTGCRAIHFIVLNVIFLATVKQKSIKHNFLIALHKKKIPEL